MSLVVNVEYFTSAPFKGIVQPDLTGVETRVKLSILMDYIFARFAFLSLKEHHHEKSTKLVSVSKQQLN
jgi:hypothetical protein